MPFFALTVPAPGAVDEGGADEADGDGELLAERGAGDIVVFGGGIIPDDDIGELRRMGVARIFTPGAPTSDIVAWVRSELGHQVAETQA